VETGGGFTDTAHWGRGAGCQRRQGEPSPHPSAPKRQRRSRCASGAPCNRVWMAANHRREAPPQHRSKRHVGIGVRSPGGRASVLRRPHFKAIISERYRCAGPLQCSDRKPR
jgi:hypothetical protein